MRLDRRAVPFPRRRASGIASAIAAAALPLHAPAGEATACLPSQQTLFACSTGTKGVAVCASQDLAVDTGLVQYRFGRPEAAELSYPPVGANWRTVTRGGTLTYSGGGGAFLAFTNGPYRYTVYTAIGQGWGRKSGVVVEKNGKRIASLVCRDTPASALGPDLFSKAGIAEAETAFELP